MSSLTILGDTSGSVVLDAPAISGSTVLTLPTQTGTLGLSGPAFSAYTPSGVGATLGTGATKVTFTAEEFDTNNNYNTSTSTFTPTVAGYYQINAQLQPNAQYTGGYIALYKNGGIYKYGNYANLGISFGGFVLNTIVYCNGSTDYLEIYGAFTTSQATASGIFFTYFNGYMVRGT